MFHKALWKKEWKHNFLVSLGLLVAFLLAYVVSAFMRFDTWRFYQEHQPDHWEHAKAFEVNSIFEPNFFGMIAVGVVILMAGFLIGLEKNTKRHDFAMALPFSRREMFLTKYAMGLAVVLIGYNLSFWLAYFAIYQSEFSQLLAEVDLTNSYWLPLAAYFVIYSFAMFIGTISGEIKSQIALTLIFLVFPQGIFVLVGQFFNVHGFDFSEVELTGWVFEDLFWFNYLNNFFFDELNIWVPVIAGLVFTVLAIVIYEKSPSEYSGEFLMFRSLHPLFAFGIPFCSALLGGLMLSSMAPHNSSDALSLILYWLGALIALFFSWKITKKLLNR
ncbi:ABC-2 transporter permease [Alkalibacillus haloalkaliphilus]|uniref:ABC transporter permease n=1 Tax=Alkalibacillus haloalkaliphilus TaxID=94136 RepID=A0A511W650_9BACI|nr:ABC-2 transporter permease [Alkalibacillus haloalkaliphilus]GEN46574.1 ABC transporter permease [Alkalibacillus haloalkaliphilus]